MTLLGLTGIQTVSWIYTKACHLNNGTAYNVANTVSYIVDTVTGEYPLPDFLQLDMSNSVSHRLLSRQ